MSKAGELIERMEKECGCRWDDNGGDNMAMAGLFGAVARILGKSNHRERDDVAAGVVLRHQMTPEYKAQQKANDIMVEMLIAGVSPDTLGDLYSVRNNHGRGYVQKAAIGRKLIWTGLGPVQIYKPAPRMGGRK